MLNTIWAIFFAFFIFCRLISQAFMQVKEDQNMKNKEKLALFKRSYCKKTLSRYKYTRNIVDVWLISLAAKNVSLTFLNVEYENWQFSKSVCSIGIARIAVLKKLIIAVNIFNALVILGSEYHMGNIFQFSHIF